ncbi:MAG: hypothetical protein C0620_00695 [Desulfuromonas sp.]|nr:MAG: hypothetical protein C0620_00695 [Desulfuromonas sp.]
MPQAMRYYGRPRPPSRPCFGIRISCRYGGENIRILAPKTDCDKAYQLAERIRKGVAKSRIDISTGDSLHVTLSIGVAQYREDEQASAFIDRADQGVYEAKQQGRNCVFALPISDKTMLSYFALIPNSTRLAGPVSGSA